ncbi:MAG: HBL/NHE enterotoxin family protein [Phaeodactylibacter sp.]|uniref:HBL/NHE enterotoxin family protein n=1 Tax=Phaeodactylibacter sp. TaxID=1940289 RepID=UPI0032ED41F9
MATTAKKINVKGVKNGMLDTVKAGFLIQTYYNVITSTPIIKLPASVDKDSNSQVVEDLPKYQNTAINHAKQYAEYDTHMEKVLGDIVLFKHTWSEFYNKLVELGKNIDEGHNRKMFTEAMTKFKSMVEEKGKTTEPIVEFLKKFLDDIEGDERNFNTATLYVTNAMAGEKGEIQTLESTIDALHSAIKKDNGMIAGGSVMMVVGALMVVGGIFGEIETSGVSTALVVGGLAMAAGGGAMTGIAAKNLESSTHSLKTDLSKLDADKKLFALTKNANANISHMKDSINQAVAAIESLQKGWDALGADFDEIIDALNNVDTTFSDWIGEELKAANDEWEDTYTLADQLQSNGKVKIVKKTV